MGTQRSFVASLCLAYEAKLVDYLHQMLGNRERAGEIAHVSFAALDAAVTVVQERLSELKRRKLSLCFYRGGYLLEDETALRVVTYAEFGCLGEGAHAVLVRNRDALLRYLAQAAFGGAPEAA